MTGYHGLFEPVVSAAYVVIFLGFALRSIVDNRPALLWPWWLVSIFALCALTRSDYAGSLELGFDAELLSHGMLAFISLGYGIFQLVYAFWPEQFERETSAEKEPWKPLPPAMIREAEELMDMRRPGN